MTRISTGAVGLLAAVLSAGRAECQTNAALANEVRAAETAFAKTMADRDFAAFTVFLADEAPIFSNHTAIPGAHNVASASKSFFIAPTAPFSWERDTNEGFDSGTLALSSEPVRSPDGNQTGLFNSIRRREADGRWKIIFDKGCSR